MAQTRILPPAENAYEYPLLIKRLLLSGPRYNPDQEIVYSNRSKYTYTDLVERIHRLANALTDAGVKPGDTVAVMDWDTPRYLECFFAIPMIGAILHTVNIRLSPDQIVYTMNHAEDDVVLVHDDFLPIIEAVKDEIKTVKTWIQLTDSNTAQQAPVEAVGEYEDLLARANDKFDFPDFDENSVATTFYTTGTTGNPKGVYFSHRQAGAAHAGHDGHRCVIRRDAADAFLVGLHASDAHVPCACLGRALCRHHDGHQASISGPL